MYFSQTESSKWSSVFLLQSALQQENLGKVCRPAMVVEVHGGEVVLRVGIASLRSALKPPPCPNNAQTSQQLDSTSMALRCSELKQPPRLTLAAAVHDGEIILRVGVASLRSALKAPPCQKSALPAPSAARAAPFTARPAA